MKKINHDTLTTVLGGAGAAVLAAQPVVNSMGGSFGQDDLVKLIMAVIIGVWGWATNKNKVPAV